VRWNTLFSGLYHALGGKQAGTKTQFGSLESHPHSADEFSAAIDTTPLNR